MTEEWNVQPEPMDEHNRHLVDNVHPSDWQNPTSDGTYNLVAIGAAWSDPSSGVGSRDETLLELFYRFHLAKAISLTPDLQLVFDPANNADDDVVVVGGIRLLLEF